MMKEAFDNFFGKPKVFWTLGEEMIFTAILFLIIGTIVACVWGIILLIEVIGKRNKRG